MKSLRFRQSLARATLVFVAAAFLSALGMRATLHAQETASEEPAWGRVPQAMVVRTTENVTQGGWVWLLNRAKEAGIGRIYLLVKQDENQYVSARTGQTLASGELLVALPGETTAAGWENSDWLVEMLARANTLGIEVFAWWPLFQDAVMAKDFRTTSMPGRGTIDLSTRRSRASARGRSSFSKSSSPPIRSTGSALDWLRYNERDGGSPGPAGEPVRRDHRKALVGGAHAAASGAGHLGRSPRRRRGRFGSRPSSPIRAGSIRKSSGALSCCRGSSKENSRRAIASSGKSVSTTCSR